LFVIQPLLYTTTNGSSNQSNFGLGKVLSIPMKTKYHNLEVPGIPGPCWGAALFHHAIRRATICLYLPNMNYTNDVTVLISWGKTCKNSPEFLDYAIYNICRNSPEFLDYDAGIHQNSRIMLFAAFVGIHQNSWNMLFIVSKGNSSIVGFHL
jgi:hypothetical protein